MGVRQVMDYAQFGGIALLGDGLQRGAAVELIRWVIEGPAMCPSAVRSRMSAVTAERLAGVSAKLRE